MACMAETPRYSVGPEFELGRWSFSPCLSILSELWTYYIIYMSHQMTNHRMSQIIQGCLNPEFSLPQLGLVVIPIPKLWQRLCSLAHRFVIYVLLLFACAIQIAVCFHRDGIGFTPQLSKGNISVCNPEHHLILSTIGLQVLVLVAYTMLLWYFTIWEPRNEERVSNCPSLYICNV